MGPCVGSKTGALQPQTVTDNGDGSDLMAYSLHIIWLCTLATIHTSFTTTGPFGNCPRFTRNL